MTLLFERPSADEHDHLAEDGFLDDDCGRDLQRMYEDTRGSIESGTPWQQAIGDFISHTNSDSYDPLHRSMFRGLLGRLLEDAYRGCLANDGGSAELADGVYGMLDNLEHIPRMFAEQIDTGKQKRTPSFYEALAGTVNRYAYMEQLPDTFSDVSQGIIVGGSMAYGPFVNVREGSYGNDPSDVDSIVVLKPGFEDPDAWEQFVRSSAIADDDKAALLSRLGDFGAMHDDNAIDVLSHRFDVPGQDYNMSTHFMTFEQFARQNGAQLARAIEDGGDETLVVRDLKPRRFEHRVCRQRSPDGSVYEYVVPEQQSVGDNIVATLPGYIVNDGRYYPGLYQNLVSPEFNPLWVDSGGDVLIAVQALRGTILRNIAELSEQGVDASLAKSHVRYEYMAPGRYAGRRADSASSLPDIEAA